MVKKDTTFWAVVVISGLAIFFILSGNTQLQSLLGVFEDFEIYGSQTEEFENLKLVSQSGNYEKVFMSTYWSKIVTKDGPIFCTPAGSCGDPYRTRHTIDNGVINWEMRRGGSFRMESQDIFGSDFRLDMRVAGDDGSCADAEPFTCNVGLIGKGCNSILSNSEDSSFLIDSSEIEPNKVTVFKNNQEICSIDAGTELKLELGCISNRPVSCGGGYVAGQGQVWITPTILRPYDCKLDIEHGDVLVGETFGAGQEFGVYDMSFNVKRFCRAFPSIIIDKAEFGAISTLELYEAMNRGEKIIPQDDQVVTMFYVANRDPSITSSCELGLAYDPNSNGCKDVTGFLTVCQNGIVEGNKCLTETAPDPQNECLAKGWTWNVDSGCIETKPIQVVCLYPDADYNSLTNKCEAIRDRCNVDEYRNGNICESNPLLQLGDVTYETSKEIKTVTDIKEEQKPDTNKFIMVGVILLLLVGVVYWWLKK